MFLLLGRSTQSALLPSDVVNRLELEVSIVSSSSNLYPNALHNKQVMGSAYVNQTVCYFLLSRLQNQDPG